MCTYNAIHIAKPQLATIIIARYRYRAKYYITIQVFFNIVFTTKDILELKCQVAKPY
jgi:hypothetical protein